MSINKKDNIFIIWFLLLVVFMLGMVGLRSYRVSQAGKFDAKTYETLEAEYAELNQSTSGINEEVSGLESERSSWLAKVDELDRQISEAQLESEGLETENEAITLSMPELDKRIEELENGEVDPYQINFTLNNFQNVVLLQNISELKEYGIYSVYDLIEPDIIKEMAMENVIKAEDNFFEQFLSDKYAAIKGNYNNYKADMFLDGTVLLEISLSNDFMYLYNLTTLEDFENSFIVDATFSDLANNPQYSVQ